MHAHPEATFFHLSAWKQVLERAFGHRTHYLLAERDGQIEGVLPLGEIRSRLFGDALISTPFCVYGGILAATPAAHSALEAAAAELAVSLGVGHLELRNRRRQHPSWPCKELHVSFETELDPGSPPGLEAIPHKRRNLVRKGVKAGLVGELDAGIDRFYPVYAESVRNLGTPAYPRRYFEVLRELFGEACEVLTVTHQGRPVATMLSFYFRDSAHPYYGGGTVGAREFAANDFMYWELMRRAAERGVRRFDFGRSKRDGGNYTFKKSWAGEPLPLYYECQLVRARELPEVNPLNPRYRMFIEGWKRLPLRVSTLLGPFLSRSLG